MANIKSQKKRNLTNAKRAARNKAVKSELKTRVKNARTAAGTDQADEAHAGKPQQRGTAGPGQDDGFLAKVLVPAGTEDVPVGAPLALIRLEVQAPPYSLLGKPGIKSISELKGKMISVGGAKDITRIFVEQMLAPHGVKPGEYDYVYAGATAQRYADAFPENTVCVFEPQKELCRQLRTNTGKRSNLRFFD